MKTQSPHSLVTGLMWLQQYIPYPGDIPIRHTCEQGIFIGFVFFSDLTKYTNCRVIIRNEYQCQLLCLLRLSEHYYICFITLFYFLCSGDNLPRYGWVAHDGTSFGIQDVVEKQFVLRTVFIKRVAGDHGGDWSWRINGQGVSLLLGCSLSSQERLMY